LRSLFLLAGLSGGFVQAQVWVTLTPSHAVVPSGGRQSFQVLVAHPGLQDDCQVSLAEGSRGGAVVDTGAGRYVYTAPYVTGVRVVHLVAASLADPDAFAWATIWILPGPEPINPEPDFLPWPEIGLPVPFPHSSQPAAPGSENWPGGPGEPGLPEEGFQGRFPGREPGVD
jgi:hypothetical protein